MSSEKTETCRREAEDCLDRAEIATDDFTEARMRKLAGQWLSKSAKAAAREKATT
jgi:hypothetical protein